MLGYHHNKVIYLSNVLLTQFTEHTPLKLSIKNGRGEYYSWSHYVLSVKTYTTEWFEHEANVLLVTEEFGIINLHLRP